MIDERGVGEATALDEGAWIYLIDHGSDRGAGDALSKRVTEACEAGGWPTVSRSAVGEGGASDPGSLFEGISHAVEHADCVVVLLGDSAGTADAELGLAYSHRRPIVGMRVSDQTHPVSRVEAMLEGYERARMIVCDDDAQCAAELRTVFDDPEFAATIRRASGERMASA
jgi:hypothetical protein